MFKNKSSMKNLENIIQNRTTSCVYPTRFFAIYKYPSIFNLRRNDEKIYYCVYSIRYKFIDNSTIIALKFLNFYTYIVFLSDHESSFFDKLSVMTFRKLSIFFIHLLKGVFVGKKLNSMADWPKSTIFLTKYNCPLI